MVTIRTMKWALKLDRKSEVMVNVSSILTTSTTNKIRLSLDNIYVTNEAVKTSKFKISTIASAVTIIIIITNKIIILCTINQNQI